MTEPMIDRLEKIVFELSQSVQEDRKKYEAQQADLIARKKETDKALKEMRRQWGDLSRKLGTIVEDFVIPDIARQLRLIANLPDDEPIAVSERTERLNPNHNNGGRQKIELDALAESRDYLLINETKSTLRSEDVTKFVALLNDIRPYFPEHQTKTIIGAVSSFNINDQVRKYANRQGLVVLALTDGLMSQQNDPGFQWKPF